MYYVTVTVLGPRYRCRGNHKHHRCPTRASMLTAPPKPWGPMSTLSKAECPSLGNRGHCKHERQKQELYEALL